MDYDRCRDFIIGNLYLTVGNDLPTYSYITQQFDKILKNKEDPKMIFNIVLLYEFIFRKLTKNSKDHIGLIKKELTDTLCKNYFLYEVNILLVDTIIKLENETSKELDRNFLEKYLY